jgi:serine/threonine-protein kinase
MFKMSHPNIIKVTDLIEEGDTVAFVMEYIEGETIKDYIERKGKLSDGEIKKLFSQMLEAVGYVHKQKLVHRDIKPSNFMINQEGQIKLMDFGIAKTTDMSSAEYTQTGTGVQMGTPMYMSPEQITETKSVTAQSDIYSLGVVLWQMVMGHKPYDIKTLSSFQLQTKIVNENLDFTDSKWDNFISKATVKKNNERYLDCEKWSIEINKVNFIRQNDVVINVENFDLHEMSVVEKSQDNITKEKTNNTSDITHIVEEKINIEELLNEMLLFMKNHKYNNENYEIINAFFKYQIHFKISQSIILKYPEISKHLINWDNTKTKKIISNHDKSLILLELNKIGINAN